MLAFVFALLLAAAAGLIATLLLRLRRLHALLQEQQAALAQALEINRELTTRDNLTGLLDRRAMMALLQQPRRSQRRGEANLALALLDIDGFKRLNDVHGHPVGDAVLQRFAELARAGLRAGDALARWSGQEFLLLMQDTSEVEALVALERVRQRIAEGGFTDLAPGLRPTFSAGLSTFVPGEPYADAIERADDALRRAKQNGRNRVEVTSLPA